MNADKTAPSYCFSIAVYRRQIRSPRLELVFPQPAKLRNRMAIRANLTVTPIALLSLTLSPTSVVGGVSSTANKVTLNGPAPAGGILVTLTSGDPGVGVPASVTVAAGATASPVFTITTSHVDTPTGVTISASYNGVNKTANLTVNP